MKLTKNPLPTALAALAGLLLACCSEGSLPDTGANDNAGGVSALHIASACLQEQSMTRATAMNLTAGSIGVFRSQDTGYAETQDNVQYIFNEATGWQPQQAARTIYLAASDAEVCAYFPYDSHICTKTIVPLTSGKYKGTADDPEKHDPADICYATNRTLNGAVPSTRFEMVHAMAMVQLHFLRAEAGTTPYNLTLVSIENANLPSTATLDITNGAYTTTGKSTLIWTPGATESATGIQIPEGHSETTSALVVPCTLDAGGTIFSFRINGNRVSTKVSAAVLPSLQAGKIHRLLFRINTTTATLSKVSIVDWQRKWDADNEPNIDGSSNDYIKLAGVKWALSNLEHNAGYHNYNFAASATATGTEFQWNALTSTEDGNGTDTWDATADPCSRLEPKGAWVTPTRANVTALIALPTVWVTDYNGVSGQWFGTADAGEAALHPEHYLFLPAGSGTEASYWTRTYDSSTDQPMTLSISSTSPPADKETAYATSHTVRCVKK